MTPRLNPYYAMTGMGLMRVIAPHTRVRRRRAMHGLGAATIAPIVSPVFHMVPLIQFRGGFSAPPPGVVKPVGPIVVGRFQIGQNSGSSGSSAAGTSSSGGASGSPVPAGYPTNQIYVDPNGAFWEYSAAQGAWLNVGTPYNVGAGAPSATPSSSAAPIAASLLPASAAPTVNVTSATSGYQDILNWLQNSTLIPHVPNWVIALGGAAVLFKISRSPAGRTR